MDGDARLIATSAIKPVCLWGENVRAAHGRRLAAAVLHLEVPYRVPFGRTAAGRKHEPKGLIELCRPGWLKPRQRGIPWWLSTR